MRTLSVIGAGGWGTALAVVLSPRFEAVQLWAHDADLPREIERTRHNESYLPGIDIPSNVYPTSSHQKAVEGADVVLLVVPSQYLRAQLELLDPHLPSGVPCVSATKGIENDTLLRMSEVVQECLGQDTKVAVLSGPTFALEIAKGQPAAVAISGDDPALTQRLQTVFSGPTLRLYANDDPIGVEIGAALKNVIAIAAGIVSGLGLGNNTIAALITRGLAEITRLAVALGGKQQTLSGLAGLGDLVLTCTGGLSRNRAVGLELARGASLQQIVGSTRMVAEGIETTAAAVELAQLHDIDMPITREMFAVLRLGKSPKLAIRELMERSLKSE